MHLTRERKIIISVLTVAMGALLLDQLFSGSGTTGPNAANADTVASAPAQDDSASPLPSAALSTGASLSDDQSVTQQLESIRQSKELAVSDVPDAFLPSAVWEVRNPTIVAETTKGRARRGNELFARSHSLSTVMKTDSGGYAVINGQIVQLADKLDGFQLVAISDNAVIMESGEIRVVLKLQSSPTSIHVERPEPAPGVTGPQADRR